MKRKKNWLCILCTLLSLCVTSSFVSCKDYEEDLRSEQQATNNVLNALKQTVEDIDKKFTGDINNIQQGLNDMQEEIDSLIKNQDKFATKEQLNEAISALADIYATKQALADVQADLQRQINEANDAINTTNGAVDIIEDSVSSYAKRLAALEAVMHEACACADKVADLTTRISNIEAWQGTINTWKSEITDWQTQVNSWKSTVETWQTNINTWQTEINNWKNSIATLPDDVAKALTEATEAKTQASLNAAAIEKQRELIDSITTVFNSNDAIQTEKLDSLAELLGKNDLLLNARQDSLIASYTTAIDSINSNINDLNTLVNDLIAENFNGKISDLRQEMLDSLAAHRNRFDAIEADIKTTKEYVAQELQKLNDEVRGIKTYLSHLITGILIQATHNPIYGSFAVPTNTNSNMLAAYYGKITSVTEFPTARSRYYADPEKTVLRTKDLQMMGVSTSSIAAGTIVSDAEDNAGTIYLTINPTNVDFTGTTFELVNSLDENAGVTLSDLEKSNKKLSFGWSRAANNGFYETKVRVEANDVDKLKARIDLNELKDAFKSVLTDRSKSTIANAVSTLYNNFDDVLDANALKASWTAEGEDMAVYSHYALAATAIQPLSYSFMQGANYQEVPYLNRVFDRVLGGVEGFVGKIVDKINIPTFDTDKYKFDKITGVTLTTDGKVNAEVKITLNIAEGEVFPGQEIEIWDNTQVPPVFIDKITVAPNAAFSKEYVDTVQVDITNMLDSIEGNINDFVTKINDDLQEINGLLDELNKINDLANSIDGIKGDVIDYLEEAFDRINNKLTSWINSANKALQPIMLIQTDNGYTKLSEIQKMPTLVNGTVVTLIPTSYTAEVLAPAYKRLVGVTNVFKANDYNINAQDGNADCLAELNSVNGQEIIGEVTDGTKTSISATLKSGYVYEFAYTAIDYFGKVVAKKCYISVK